MCVYTGPPPQFFVGQRVMITSTTNHFAEVAIVRKVGNIYDEDEMTFAIRVESERLKPGMMFEFAQDFDSERWFLIDGQLPEKGLCQLGPIYIIE